MSVSEKICFLPHSHLQFAAIHLQQLLSIDVSRTEFWDILLHVESSEPLADLLSRPGRVRFISGLRKRREHSESQV